MPEQNEIELSWVLSVLRRRWKLIIALGILATLTALAVTSWMPPIYEATTTLLISPAHNSTASQLNDLMASEQLALTYSQLLKDRTVLTTVKEQLGLKQSIAELAQNIQAASIRDTQLIKITVSDADPNQAALIANTVAQTFKGRVESLSAERYAATIKNAQDRANRFQSRIEELEIQIDSLRSQDIEKTVLLSNKQVGLDTLWKETQSLQDNQQQIELTIAEATGNILIFEPVQVKSSPAIGANTASAVVSVGQVQPVGAVTTTTNAADMYRDLIIRPPLLEKIIQDLGLAETSTQLDSKIAVETVTGTQLIRISVTDADAYKAELIGKALVDSFLAQLKDLQSRPYSERLANIQTQLEETTSSIETSQNEIATLTAAIAQLQSEIDRAESELTNNRTDFRESQKELDGVYITAAESSDSVVISESAQAPKNPSQNRMLYILVAGVVGVAIGAGLAFLMDFIDDRIHSDQDLHRTFDVPTLGSIGLFGNQVDELVMNSQPASSPADDFRILSTQIRRMVEKQNFHTFLVTSPTPMEGKSVIVSNLALALANIGLDVIAVDADMRLPRLHKIFGLYQEGGLSNSLCNEENDGCLQDTQLAGISVLQNTQVNGLRVLTSGATPPNPAELLASPNLEKLINELTSLANIILIDCPPVLTAADASIVSSEVDGVLLVLKAGKSENQSAKRAIEALRQAKANVLGVVLNAVPEQKEGYENYYRDWNSKTSGLKNWGLLKSHRAK